jgi:tetratricopeptide (TPR) repeat protein
MKKWIFIVLVLTLFTTGCRHNRLIKRGDAHFEQGNYSMALKHYRAAQQRRPNSLRARQRIELAEERLLEFILVSTREALAAGDYIEAIEYASFGLSEFPREKAILDNVNTVVDRVSRVADEDYEQGYFASALFFYQSLDQTFPGHERRLAPRITQIRQGWSETLVVRANEAVAAQQPARAYLLLSKAHELVPASVPYSRIQTLRQEVIDRHSYHVALATSARPSPAIQAINETLATAAFPQALRVGSRESDEVPGAVIQLTTQQPRFERSRETRNETVEYQSGVRRVRNPDHASKLVEVDEKKKEVALAKTELARQEAEVRRHQIIVTREGASPDQETEAQRNLAAVRDRRGEAAAALDAREEELSTLEADLAALPRFVEEPVYANHTFAVTTHRIKARLALTGRVDGKNAADTIALDWEIELVVEDDEYAAQPVIGLEKKDLALPSQQELTRALHDEAATHVLYGIYESFDAYRWRFVEGSGRAHDTAQSADLLATYLILDPDRSDEGVYLTIAELEDIPNAADFF